jgi:hypothetical protein
MQGTPAQVGEAPPEPGRDRWNRSFELTRMCAAISLRQNMADARIRILFGQREMIK